LEAPARILQKDYAMDYSKIDAPLGEALAESAAKNESNLLVFIHADRDLSQVEPAELHPLGVDPNIMKGRIATATLSASAVEKLSHLPWVRSIKLSQKLRPLGDD
jgi:hypothetical protein